MLCGRICSPRKLVIRLEPTTGAAIRRTPTRRPSIAFVNVEIVKLRPASAMMLPCWIRRLIVKYSVPESGSEHAMSTRKSLRSVSVTVSLDACLFCGQKRWKHRKRKRESEPLSECMTFQAALAITEAANARQDERILRELQPRPYAIASELRYHRSCYAAYTDKRSIQSILEKRVAEEDAGAEEQGSPFQRAFCHLKAEVEKIKLMPQLL